MKPELSWCKNLVSIHGMPEHIDEVVEFVRGQKEFDLGHRLNGETVEGALFTFHSIIPIKSKSWSYALGLENWNSKTDAINVEMYYEDNYVVYEFLTPWSAPYPVAEKLIKTFPDIFCSWHYHEPQNMLSGYIKFKSKI